MGIERIIAGAAAEAVAGAGTAAQRIVAITARQSVGQQRALQEVVASRAQQIDRGGRLAEAGYGQVVGGQVAGGDALQDENRLPGAGAARIGLQHGVARAVADDLEIAAERIGRGGQAPAIEAVVVVGVGEGREQLREVEHVAARAGGEVGDFIGRVVDAVTAAVLDGIDDVGIAPGAAGQDRGGVGVERRYFEEDVVAVATGDRVAAARRTRVRAPRADVAGPLVDRVIAGAGQHALVAGVADRDAVIAVAERGVAAAFGADVVVTEPGVDRAARITVNGIVADAGVERAACTGTEIVVTVAAAEAAGRSGAERVVAVAAGQRAGVAAGEIVVAGIAYECRAGAGVHRIVAESAIDGVTGAVVHVDIVVAVAGDDGAVERAIDRVAAGAAGDGIAAGRADCDVIAEIAGDDRIGASSRVDRATGGAGAVVDEVIAGAAEQRVAAGAADHCVVAGSATQRVVAGSAIEAVVAGIAVQRVVAIQTGKGVGENAPADVIGSGRSRGIDRGTGLDEGLDEVVARQLRRRDTGEAQEADPVPVGLGGDLEQRVGAVGDVLEEAIGEGVVPGRHPRRSAAVVHQVVDHHGKIDLVAAGAGGEVGHDVGRGDRVRAATGGIDDVGVDAGAAGQLVPAR